jgi:hypothetical protein
MSLAGGGAMGGFSMPPGTALGDQALATGQYQLNPPKGTHSAILSVSIGATVTIPPGGNVYNFGQGPYGLRGDLNGMTIDVAGNPCYIAWYGNVPQETSGGGPTPPVFDPNTIADLLAYISPNDITTLAQDVAGTVPVDGDFQVVGNVINKLAGSLNPWVSDGGDTDADKSVTDILSKVG